MPKQFFINVFIEIPEELFDLSYSVLNDQPIQGIEERTDSLLVSFREEDWTTERAEQIERELVELIPQARIVKQERVEQQNWNASWEQSLEPIVISDRIVITPSWHAESQTHPICIIVDPKMSFGTGYHPTTRMTTRLLEEYVLPGSKWIDAGTGTGVLAIAAVKLGASSVFAFDNDEWSFENASENVERNAVQDCIEVRQADVFTLELPEANGIAANMYRNVLIPVFPKLHAALRAIGDPLIISGILQYDEDELILAARDSGFKHIRTEREDEWLAIVFQKA